MHYVCVFEVVIVWSAYLSHSGNLSSCKWRPILIPKTIGNRKRDCAWGCARGINTTWEICRSKSTNQEGMRSAHRTDLWFSICRFSQVVFIPRAQPHAQSLFLFPIVFGFNLIHFFRWEKGRCSRKFDRLFRCFNPLSRHLTEAKRRRRTVSKSATFLATRSVNELSALEEGRS